jgi:hypothetical protein
MKRFWTMKVPNRGLNIGDGAYSTCRYLVVLSTVFFLTACDTLEGVGNAMGGWTDSISQSVAGFNPLGAEAIAIGRSTPVLAGNTFVSGGDNGLRLNFSYDFRLTAQQDSVIDGKSTVSWLFVDHRLENGETYLQFHRVEGGSLKDFGEGESFSINRASVKAQNFCIGAASKEIPPFVTSYIDFVRSEGLPVPREYLLRRMTENLDRDGISYRVDIVYMEDILRAGYTCEEIGNLLLPSSDSIKAFLEAYKKRSERSFEIVG